MYSEAYGDIRDVTEGAIAHCITADYSLGAGIAKELDEKYNLRSTLLNVGTSAFPHCIPVKTKDITIYNLVTKANRYSKPTYEDLESCIMQMKEQLLEENIETVYVPKLGCGKDRLDWEIVRELLKKHFEKEEKIDLTVLLWF